MKAEFAGNPVDFPRGFQRVDSMEQFKQGKCLTDFILLQMSDEMPPALGGEEGDFDPGLLDPTFPKEEQTVLEGFPEFLGRVCFGDGDQSGRLGRRPGSFLHGGKNVLPDLIQAMLKHVS